MHKAITVSIVTYNAEKDLPACLKSLKNQTFQDFDLIIVDNGSTDKTQVIAEQIYPTCQFVQTGANVGFGAAHNIAISKSESEWILILNADTILNSTALQNLYTATAQSRTAAISGILYRNKEQTEIDSTGILISPLFYHARERKAVPDSDDYPWGLTGACVLLRKEALMQIAYPRTNRAYPEYFDEGFFLYKEDLDLAARLNQKGWIASFVKKDIGVHFRAGASEISRQDLPEYVKANSYKNHFYFLFKHARFYAVPFIGLYELAKFFYLLVFEPKTLRVLPEVIKTAPKMIKRRYV